MVSAGVVSQMVLIALVWLCIMPYWTQPGAPAACPTTPEISPPLPQYQSEPKPFADLIHKPHCDTLKDYILERALPSLPEAESLSEEDAFRQLEAFLKPRIEAAERGEVTGKSVEQIFEEVRRNLRP